MRFLLRSKLHIILSVTLALFFAVNSASPHVSAASLPPQALAGYTPSVVTSGQARLLGQHRGTDHLALTIGLPLRNQQALTHLLQEVSTPRSALYRHYLTQTQANQAFNPTPQQERQVIGWVQSHGLRVTHTYPNHLLVDVTGTFAQIEHLFHVKINDYTIQLAGNQTTFYAPANNPTVDASVRNLINTVVGLDDYPRFHLDAVLTSTRPAGNGTAHGSPPYYPQDFADAYDVNPLWNAGDTGVGQHIGIVLWSTPPSDTTLKQFSTQTGANVATQANGRLQVILVDGGPQYSAGPYGAAEAAMDIEYTSGMAPGATIDYYAAPDTSQGGSTDIGLEDALNLAGTDANNNAQISNSWGRCEGSNTPFINAVEPILQSNTVTGHDYFFSSGDTGSACVTNPNPCMNPDPYPRYPASSAYVTSVGGTSFNGNVKGSYPGEDAWHYTPKCAIGLHQPVGGGGYSQKPPVGSGGGYSQLFAQPGWQVGFSKSTYRGYPDVAADADPATGAYICYDDPKQGSICSNPGIIGNGTSLATPLWAGMVADANQYVQAQKELPLGFINPLLYTMTSLGSPYPAYHDITTGTNGKYSTGPGWDAVTGLGSPDLYQLARAAASLDVSASNKDQLYGIAAVSATDLWAVGYYHDAKGNPDPLIEQWNGSSWNLVPAAVPSGQSVLTSVATVSATDVWAVGSVEDSNYDVYTLIEHWNGNSWTVVPSPDPYQDYNDLLGVAAVSANDVWAVGTGGHGNNNTLIEHWDGSSWMVVPSPSPAPGGFIQLSGVAAVSANDVWAVGWYEDSSANFNTLIEHWDGSSWTVIPSPNPDPNGQENVLSSLAAVSANDVWAVGAYVDSSGNTDTLIMHWDGSNWMVVSSPNPGPGWFGGNFLVGVAAISATDVWAGGFYYDSNYAPVNFFEQWNGSTWTVVSSPNP